MDKIYSDYVNEIFGSKEVVLKEMFATLFLEIIKTFPEEVTTHDIQYIEELRTTWPDEQDLNITLQRFSWKHFSDDRISSILNKKITSRFSIADIRKIFDTREMKASQSRSRLKKGYEKDFKIISFEEYAVIAEHLIYWRNKASHRGGIRNISQALAIYSEISLLLKIYPDNLRQKVSGLDNYQKYLNENFLQSIFIDTDINPLSKNNFNEGSQSVPANDNSLLMNLEMDTLKDSISELRDLNQDNSSMIGFIKKNLVQIGQAINQTNLFLNNRNPTEVNEIIGNNAITDTHSQDQELDESDLLVSNAFNNEEPFDDAENDYTEEIPNLTSDEILDELLLLRDSIDIEMTKKNRSFRNWHNICQRAISYTLATLKPKLVDELKKTSQFNHYYNSLQRPSYVEANKTAEEINALNTEAKTFMDEQLEIYWDSIQEILHGRKEGLVDIYDARRVFLYEGLIIFYEKIKQTNYSATIEIINDQVSQRKLNPDRYRVNSLSLIFLVGLNERINEDSIETRAILKDISDYEEEGYEEDALYNQFFELISGSVIKKSIEGNSVLGGGAKYQSLEALKKLFGFDHEDFIDAFFGDHGWERLPMMSANKQKILSMINDLSSLSLLEILDAADQFEMNFQSKKLNQ